MTNDLYLTEQPTVINSFSGTLDGQGHTILGLSMQGSIENISTYRLAMIIENTGTIKNLAVDTPNIIVTGGTKDSGPLVGAMQGLDYEACRTELAPGEYCLLYTDGVSEAMNEKLELFGEERIAATLEGLRGASPEEVLHGVMQAVKEHRGTAAQSDDITMLCFRRSEI